MRIRSIPFSLEVEQFLSEGQRIYLIDLNKDAQMLGILKMELPQLGNQMISLRHYEGTPITADKISEFVIKNERG